MSADMSTVVSIPFASLPQTSREEGEKFLLQAFRSFAEAADSLERSYGMLRSEVARLRGELEQSNAGLERSLEENRQMREHLDGILEGLPCGVLVAKSDGAITLVNPEAKRLLGACEEGSFEPGSWGESGFAALGSLPGAWRDLLERARSASSEREECVRDGRGAERGGERGGERENERWLAVRHAEIPCVAGNEGRASIFILRDVSDARRLVEQRDKLRREQALAEMSAVLAHEIRNPLGSLELFAGLLAGAALPAECRAWVEHIQAGLRTLAATVNNVLHFHSLPAPERMATDLGQLLDWAGGFLVPMARQARVELCLRNRLRGVQFPADRHRLEQVLLNLVLNAFRAMPGGGWVEISGHKIRHGSMPAVSISVSDTGPGIPQAELKKIFEPGFSTRAGSPGLGLAVCQKIVEQHGGSLIAGNRAGVGASFTLSFPLAEELPRKERLPGMTNGEVAG